MVKFALLPVLVIAACLTAGLYGALHNQISYTVSPDYFHAHKFQQFAIPEPLHNRLGAAVVGFRASWWMGYFVGLPVLLVGLLLPGWKNYVRHSLMAFVVVAGTALLVGLGALAWACFNSPDVSAAPSGNPHGGIDWVAFHCAATMHDYSYTGGFLGIVTGSLYLIVQRLRRSRVATSATQSP